MRKVRILIIDGQGGGIGKQLTQNIKAEFSDIEIRAVGTNVLATQAMIKAGADEAATGENSVIAACRKADIIIGPIGIVIADALMGEITPKIAAAVGQSDAIRILLPTNQCDNRIAGVENFTVSYLIKSSLEQLRKCIETLS